MSSRFASDDPYVDPATGVLRNLLSITDRLTLEQVEADISFAAAIVLADHPLPGTYDLVHLQGFHRVLFGDIYAWAGELRTVQIARTEPFCLPQHIESFAAEVFGAIRRDGYLRGLDRPSFRLQLAHHFGEVNALHPFREGNGRAQRAFFGQLAIEAGWMLRWDRLDPQENAEASRASLLGDLAPLTALLDALIQPASATTGRTG